MASQESWQAADDGVSEGSGPLSGGLIMNGADDTEDDDLSESNTKASSRHHNANKRPHARVVVHKSVRIEKASTSNLLVIFG